MQSGAALLLIDTINAMDFEGSEGLVAAASQAAINIERLARSAREQNVPVVYVNDNYGKWRSDFRATYESCTAADKPGREVSARLRPQAQDYFVLKPRHSGFFSTSLDLLLDHLGVDCLVLTGFATNLCVLFTANDAHMRGYQLLVPQDCTASNTPALTQRALAHAREALAAGTPLSSEIDFPHLKNLRKKPRSQGL
jgi:nicotinamidase-related amidase